MNIFKVTETFIKASSGSKVVTEKHFSREESAKAHSRKRRARHQFIVGSDWLVSILEDEVTSPKSGLPEGLYVYHMEELVVHD